MKWINIIGALLGLVITAIQLLYPMDANSLLMATKDIIFSIGNGAPTWFLVVSLLFINIFGICAVILFLFKVIASFTRR